ncbi:PopZ family protein [Pararhizobium gei]|uniref:PopZ family protein n=1 Tax=Pararhizobium gei TaxID=1395951 RepID=UPI0023DB8A90|nr:PopZ family protein [Rhizobium gei]
MPQPNTAREPSMDEILASIRKIIESNEPGIPGFPANDLGHAPQDTYHGDSVYDDAEIELTIDEDVLTAEFAADLHKADAAPERVEAQPAPVRPAASLSPPLSLADVAARVRAASERNATPLRDEETAAYRPAFVQPEAVQPEPMQQEPVQQADTATAALTTELPHANEAEQIAPAPGQNATYLAAESAQESSPEREVTALVSPAVGEQVARSFGDLALAIDSKPRRSFDEIAEDMLRPMLQEWLDDNLPTLVERLVREEIERVARGPRR